MRGEDEEAEIGERVRLNRWRILLKLSVHRET